MFNVHIPEVSREEIINRYSDIKPVVKKGDKLYWLRKFRDEELFSINYLWNDETENPVEEGEIIPIPGRDFRCLHKYGYYGLFEPSISEVLAQIDPYEAPGPVVAFEIIDSPKTADDFYKDELTANAFNSGYHVSTVRLYQRP